MGVAWRSCSRLCKNDANPSSCLAGVHINLNHIDIIHGTGSETTHAIMTSHFHPHLPGTFGANKMASVCVVSSNCLNYPRQYSYFTIVQTTHPIPPYKFCSCGIEIFLTATILFKIITALIVRYSQ